MIPYLVSVQDAILVSFRQIVVFHAEDLMTWCVQLIQVDIVIAMTK